MAEKLTYLIFIMLFWVLVTVFSQYFEESILLGDVTQLTPDGSKVEKSVLGNILDQLSVLPIIQQFVPLFRIMSFQYTDQIPAVISYFLIIISIISAYIVYSMIRGY